jgi:hypothetical protein
VEKLKIKTSEIFILAALGWQNGENEELWILSIHGL